MTRASEWLEAQIVDVGVVIAAFIRGFREGMRK
jgi:hypothetical protein